MWNRPTDSSITYDIQPATEDELKEALWRTSPRKAPGLDLIAAKIARKAWPRIKSYLLKLVNEVLMPKSNRPVSLLLTFAKALERIICKRIDQETSPRMSGLQYGLFAGRSTETAIEDLLYSHDDHDRQIAKYTMAMFLDISGAFDNMQLEILLNDM